MKTIIMISVVMVLSGCFGRESVDNEAIGQVKRVVHQTPIFCPPFYALDLSLGVMRNGVGSMSTHDEWFYLSKVEDAVLLEKAAENGALVKLKYDVERITFCIPDHEVMKVELLK